MKEYKTVLAYSDNYTVEKYEGGKLIGDDIISYYNLDGYIECLKSEGYVRMLNDDDEMNFTQFVGYCNDGRIKCSEQTKGLLHVFGEEVYGNYYDLIQMQILNPEGYELIIRKKNN